MTYTEELAKLLETTPERVSFTSYSAGSFEINTINPYGKPEPVAKFFLKEAPGCCGMIFSYHASVQELYRNRGIGTVLNKMRQKIAYELGYSAIICTDLNSNEHQLTILRGQKWAQVASFVNRRTRNGLSVHIKNLSPDPQALGQYFIGPGASVSRPK